MPTGASTTWTATAKFPFKAPIVRIPEWRALAAVAVGLAALMLLVFSVDSRKLANVGRGFLAVVAYATATAVVWLLYEYSQQYMTISTVLVGILLMLGTVGVIAVLLAEAHEWAEAQWATSMASPAADCRAAAPKRTEAVPKVSIHVPCYNEPPAMVIETLDALADLDYPDFEVLVIDNNTRDEAVWRPVEARCLELGARFRFFHVAPLAGFKAGALNFALAHTAPDAAVVAVIDSDYVVTRDWLRHLVPAFANPKLAIVQAPQDYRDPLDNAFKASCYAEYAGFFQIGMVTRNERNAIIQHGTMTLVRRTALQDSGGWAEWCITEDAELGLRIFEQGWDAAYIPRSYGRGLMPDTFNDFRKQRFRWAYGAIQILRRHASVLFNWRNPSLTPGQRYHFLAGWLPWIADGANLLFNFAALAWSIGMVFAPRAVDPPLMIFSVLPLSLFAFKAVKLVDLYRTCVGAGPRQIAAAALAGLGLVAHRWRCRHRRLPDEGQALLSHTQAGAPLRAADGSRLGARGVADDHRAAAGGLGCERDRPDGQSGSGHLDRCTAHPDCALPGDDRHVAGQRTAATGERGRPAEAARPAVLRAGAPSGATSAETAAEVAAEIAAEVAAEAAPTK